MKNNQANQNTILLWGRWRERTLLTSAEHGRSYEVGERGRLIPPHLHSPLDDLTQIEIQQTSLGLPDLLITDKQATLSPCPITKKSFQKTPPRSQQQLVGPETPFLNKHEIGQRPGRRWKGLPSLVHLFHAGCVFISLQRWDFIRRSYTRLFCNHLIFINT